MNRTKLPGRNAAVANLHLSLTGYRAILEWLRTEPAIRSAWIVGSRWKGIRRNPDKPSVPDVDLVVLLDVPEEERTDQMFRLRKAAQLISTLHEPIHLEFAEPGSFVAGILAEGGALIFSCDPE